MWLKLQDRGDKWCKMKMTIYLGYRVVPLKVICHSIGAVFILENFVKLLSLYVVLVTAGYFCVTATYFL